MSKLIILSNRVSIPTQGKTVAGGLAVAIQDALCEVGGVWMGWNGEKIEESAEQEFSSVQQGHIEYMTSPLTQAQYAGYYSGFANDTLWPAMHERSDLIRYNKQDDKIYADVNRFFAQQICKIAQPEDIIWIHDYHFMSVARYCRDMGMSNKIGFFLHIPFAPLPFWQHIPNATQLIEDLCHYDVVGLQTHHDQVNCMQVCKSLIKAQELQQYLLTYRQHIVVIKDYPIGINPTAIEEAAEEAEGYDDLIDDGVSVSNENKTIIGVDRIDYSKGLLQRFSAYAEFFSQNPRYLNKVQHLQVASPCRLEVPAYQHLFEQFKIKVDLINEEFKQPDWQPIQCIYDSIDHHQLMHLYRHSDICWVSSLHDGMNLVAKEYIAAQDPRNPGVLILSKYAGAVEKMTDAVIIDPNRQNDMIRALKQAIEMPLKERIARHRKLMRVLKQFDINDWRNEFLNDLKFKNPLQQFKYTTSNHQQTLYPIHE